jgi:hypothetical protein
MRLQNEIPFSSQQCQILLTSGMRLRFTHSPGVIVLLTLRRRPSGRAGAIGHPSALTGFQGAKNTDVVRQLTDTANA